MEYKTVITVSGVISVLFVQTATTGTHRVIHVSNIPCKDQIVHKIVFLAEKMDASSVCLDIKFIRVIVSVLSKIV